MKKAKNKWLQFGWDFLIVAGAMLLINLVRYRDNFFNNDIFYAFIIVLIISIILLIIGFKKKN